MYNNNGLNNEEVKENRKKYGSNNISGKNTNTFFNLFIETLGDPIIKILIIALAVKTIFLFKDFDYFETIGIVIAILVASLISAISEYGSNKAFERMQEESSKINVRVRRNKKIIEISIDDIVKNDVIILSSGEKIPADGILIRGKLSVDESSLNGESKEVYKELTKDINIISDKNKVYRGTTIYDGTAEVLITKVGMDTLYGKMAKELTTGEDISPLKLRLTNLAKIISKIGYIAAILIAISYLFSKIFILNNFNLSIIKAIPLNTIIGYILEAMTLAVSVLVMAVPEGLPMMITLVLSTNSKKMLKNKVLVRKMVGIETAGSLNILFTDKTGTITNGKMEVISILDGSLNEYTNINELLPSYRQILIDSIIYNNDSEYDSTTNKIIGGNITDKALLSFAGQNKKDTIKIIDKIMFNSQNKYSISIIEKNNNYLEELSKKVDKISERKYVESKLKGMNGFLTSSLRYIWLLSLTPLRGILPGIGARTVATRKLLHNMLKNMHYEKQEKIIYSLGNYESEINNKIYDIDSLNYNIDLALEDVQKLKKEFKDYFLSYSFKEYDKAYKKIELIEKNIIDNKNKVYLIKEKLIKSKELNRNTLTKVRKLNDKN